MTLMRVLYKLAVVELGLAAVALLTAIGVEVIWRWFAAAKYGAGPGVAIWFAGVQVVRMLQTGGNSSASDAEADLETKAYGPSGVVHRVAVQAICIASALGMCFLVGWVAGWVR